MDLTEMQACEECGLLSNKQFCSSCHKKRYNAFTFSTLKCHDCDNSVASIKFTHCRDCFFGTHQIEEDICNEEDDDDDDNENCLMCEEVTTNKKPFCASCFQERVQNKDILCCASQGCLNFVGVHYFRCIVCNTSDGQGNNKKKDLKANQAEGRRRRRRKNKEKKKLLLQQA